MKKMASLTIVESDDGMREMVIMSHPDKNELEEVLVSIVGLINAMIKESNKTNTELAK